MDKKLSLSDRELQAELHKIRYLPEDQWEVKMRELYAGRKGRRPIYPSEKARKMQEHRTRMRNAMAEKRTRSKSLREGELVVTLDSMTMGIIKDRTKRLRAEAKKAEKKNGERAQVPGYGTAIAEIIEDNASLYSEIRALKEKIAYLEKDIEREKALVAKLVGINK